ncbi:SEC10/PgrA surface exclusion domain-containing protein, partial [Lactobacillus bombicola]
KPDNGSASNSSSKNVHPASIKLPSGYTRDRLAAAYMAGYPSATNVDSDFVKVCKQGMENNTFDSSNDIDQAGDDTISVDPTNLTKDQQAEISSFALRLINGARADLGLKPWISSTGTQKLANDIATEYTSDQWSGYANGHDVKGIIRAAKKNGLNIDDQYIEDLYSLCGVTITTMSELKKVVYQGLTMMIFGGVNASTNPNNPQNCEWHHAGNLLGTMGNHRFDDEDFYFGISISKTSNKEYDIHYINVSSYFINGSYDQDHHSTFNPGKDQNGKDIIVPTLKEIVSKKFSIVDFRQEFLKKINDSREKDSLAPVVENEKITEPNNLIDVVEGPFSDNSKLTADKFFLSGDNYYMNPNIKEIWINAKVLETGEIRCEVSVSYN